MYQGSLGVILALSFVACANSADFSPHDLDGFVYKQSILNLKDTTIPIPARSIEIGITSGAVFILGTYLPPPYTITAAGNTLLINGVPCLDSIKLLPIAKSKDEEIVISLQYDAKVKLPNVYLSALFQQGSEEAERKLKEFIANMKDMSLSGIETVKADPSKYIILHNQDTTTGQSLRDFKIPLRDPDDLQKWIDHCNEAKKQNQEGLNKVTCLGYDIVEMVDEDIPENLIAHLNHAITGKFDVTVDGSMIRDDWVITTGRILLYKKMNDLISSNNTDLTTVCDQLAKFASEQVWVKSFEIIGNDPMVWILNGRNFNNHYFLIESSGLNTETEEISKGIDASDHLNQYTIPRLEKLLKNDTACFFHNGQTTMNNFPNLLSSIQEIIHSELTLNHRRSKLIEFFEAHGMGTPDAVKTAEFLAVFFKD